MDSSADVLSPETPETTTVTTPETVGKARPPRDLRLAVEKHPQYQQIVDAMLRGQSDLAISKWITPKVSRVSIAKFRIKKLKPSIAAAAKIGHPSPPQSVTDDPSTRAHQAAHLARSGLLSAPLITRVEKMVQGLENATFDALADRERDLKGIAAVSGAYNKTVETLGRLQLHPGYVPGLPMGSGIHVHLHVGAAAQRSESPAESPSGEVITVEALEVDLTASRKLT